MTGLDVESSMGDDIAQYYTMRSGQGGTSAETEESAGTSEQQAQTQTGSGQEG